MPLPEPDEQLSDFSIGLVADLLTFRGLPLIDGPDFERLRTALRWFAYGIGCPEEAAR